MLSIKILMPNLGESYNQSHHDPSKRSKVRSERKMQYIFKFHYLENMLALLHVITRCFNLRWRTLLFGYMSQLQEQLSKRWNASEDNKREEWDFYTVMYWLTVYVPIYRIIALFNATTGLHLSESTGRRCILRFKTTLLFRNDFYRRRILNHLYYGVG